MLVLLLILGWALVEPYWLEVKNIEYSQDVPAGFDNYKIVFLTDIHYGPYFSAGRVREIVEETNALKPDLILLGGDYISGNVNEIAPVFSELARLRAKDGVYGVLGNHDWRENGQLAWYKMQEAGIKILDNRAVWLQRGEDKIRLGGVGDWWTDEVDFGPTTLDVGEKDLVIMVGHNPDVAEFENSGKIDLMLSGHMHGGQVTFFGMWGMVPSYYGQKYRVGWVRGKAMDVYVSRGIGNTIIPVRFWCRPELTVLTLKSREEK